MTGAVSFTVACIVALAVALVIAVQRTVSNPIKRQAFDDALAVIASSELENVDTALNKSKTQRQTWHVYWYELFSRSGRETDSIRKPGEWAAAAAGLSALFGLFVIGPPLGLLAAPGMLLAIRAFLKNEAHKRVATMEKQLPLLITALRAQIQAGSTVVQAINGVAADIPQPLGDEIRLLRQDLGLNVPLEQALQSLVRRVPSREMQFLGASMEIAIRSGQDLDPQLKIIGEVVAQRTRIRQKLKSAVSQVKPTAYLAYAAVPLMFLNSQREPENRVYWFSSSQGFVILIVVCTLYGAGIFAIRTMVRSVEKM